MAGPGRNSEFGSSDCWDGLAGMEPNCGSRTWFNLIKALPLGSAAWLKQWTLSKRIAVKSGIHDFCVCTWTSLSFYFLIWQNRLKGMRWGLNQSTICTKFSRGPGTKEHLWASAVWLGQRAASSSPSMILLVFSYLELSGWFWVGWGH